VKLQARGAHAERASPGKRKERVMNYDDQAISAMLVEQGPDAVIYADLQGLIRVWNPAAERIFGRAAADAVGQRLDIIIPEPLRDAHWQGYARAIEAGDTKYRGQSLPTKALKADGSAFYVELSFSILRAPDGNVLGAMAQARDITERFERDRVTRRRLRELEGMLNTEEA
jgi:PAS domain S-box-containing protein